MQKTVDAGLKILTSPPVFDTLYMLCSPATLCNIAKTCNGARQAIENYFKHAFDVNKLLARFFGKDDALEFRRLQARLNFIVSGSQALQLLDRTVYPKSDLDVYVVSSSAEEVGRWLLMRGYEFSPHEDDRVDFPTFESALARNRLEDEDYDLPAVHDVFNFEKHSQVSAEIVRSVQVIVVHKDPLDTVLNFHSTVVMNFFLWDRAYALYPQATFEQRRGLVTGSSPGQKAALSKYTRRGFHIECRPTRRCAQDAPFWLGGRVLGDAHCWTLKLDTSCIDHSKSISTNESKSWVITALKSWTLIWCEIANSNTGCCDIGRGISF